MFARWGHRWAVFSDCAVESTLSLRHILLDLLRLLEMRLRGGLVATEHIGSPQHLMGCRPIRTQTKRFIEFGDRGVDLSQASET